MESEMRHNMKLTKLILTNAEPGFALKTTSFVAAPYIYNSRPI